MTLEELELLKQPDIYKYVKIYKDSNSKELALKLSKNNMLPVRAIAEQVLCNQKAKNKLPSFKDKNLLFNRVALEQSSSEATAKYKSSLISGSGIIDLTGGLGIDDLFFANSFNTVLYCDLNNVTSELFKYNISQLNILNIEVNNTESIEFLSKQEKNLFDWIYIDPSRRDSNRRSVDLEYCAPNVYDNMELFFEKSENVMIKTAPAYDLTEAVRRFPNLLEIHVISVDGECKEVLLLLNRDRTNVSPKVFSVDLNSKNDKRFILSGIFSIDSVREITEIKLYFYEPDCSIIKSNLTPLLAKKYNLSFINKLTPYLTNSELIKDFPGRCFRKLDFMVFNEKLIKRYLKENKIAKANVSKRDFRLSVDEIRAKFKIKDGGEYYLFFTRNISGKSIMIVCKK